MKKKQNNALRRVQHVLIIILPLSLVVLIALLIANMFFHQPSRVNQDVFAPDSAPSEELTIPSSDTANDDNPSKDTTPPQTSDSTQQPSSSDKSDATPDTDSPVQSQPVTLLFTGDVLLSDYVINNYKNSGIDGVLSPELLEELRGADITVINNEFPFSTRGTKAPDKQYTFRVNPEYVSILTDMGVDIAGLANNHVLDYGADALLDTFDTLAHAGIDYMGAGRDLASASALISREINGKTFGFLAASRVIPVVSWDVQNASPGVFTTYDPSRLIEAITSAKDTCDYLTVFVHWGIERDQYPQDYQVTMAQQYIDAGADLVIGSHPHVLQGISYYKEKPIFYSLGNFIFNQSIPKTAAVKVTIDDKSEPVIQLIAATASNARTTTCDDSQRTAIYKDLSEISTGISIDDNGILSQE